MSLRIAIAAVEDVPSLFCGSDKCFLPFELAVGLKYLVKCTLCFEFCDNLTCKVISKFRFLEAG